MKILLLLLLAAPLAAQSVGKTPAVDTVRISVYQQRQLTELKTQADEIARLQQLILQTIVASKHDPKDLDRWDLQLTDSMIVFVPKTDSPPKPKKP